MTLSNGRDADGNFLADVQGLVSGLQANFSADMRVDTRG